LNRGEFIGTHVEELAFPSVNMLIHGEPKMWLSFAPRHETVDTVALLCA